PPRHLRRRAPAGALVAHEPGWRNDRDAAERVEHKKIGIAAYDLIGMAVDGQLQKLVVLRIAASGDPFRNRYQLRRCDHLLQPNAKALRDQWRKARPRQRQRDEQLLFGRRGFKKNAPICREMNRLIRWRYLLQRGADENVGIDDN